MKVTKFTTCIFLFGTVYFIGCDSDKNQKALLNGRWEMKYGEFNNQPAPMLQGMYFQFTGKNLTTNFNEATHEETTPFEYKDDIIIKESTPNVEFQIVSLTDSVLEMTTELRGYDFKLVLQHVSQ